MNKISVVRYGLRTVFPMFPEEEEDVDIEFGLW